MKSGATTNVARSNGGTGAETRSRDLVVEDGAEVDVGGGGHSVGNDTAADRQSLIQFLVFIKCKNRTYPVQTP